jgi:hypothetical protein
MKGKFKFFGPIFLFLFLFLSAEHAGAHKFYVSLCRIHYVRDSSQLQIVMKIFTDDLEKALSEAENREVRLGTERDPQKGDSLIALYLGRHFRLFTGGKEIPVHYLGKQVEYDVTWCYLESWPEEDLRELTVENDVLTEVYPSQINLVEVSYDGEKKGVMLNRDKIKGSVRFD